MEEVPLVLAELPSKAILFDCLKIKFWLPKLRNHSSPLVSCANHIRYLLCDYLDLLFW